MNKLDSKCSEFYRYLLIVFNVFVFILGLLTVILAAILRWSKLDGLSKLDDVLNVAKIHSVAIFILVIGAFALLLSLIGILGLCCLNRFFLYIYEICIVILLCAHGIGLLVLVFGRSGVEKQFRTELDKIAKELNENQNTTGKFCDEMKTISILFKCCGSESPSVFKQQSIIDKCCSTDKIKFNIGQNSTDLGCNTLAIKSIHDNSRDFIIIPSCIILIVELIIIIVTALLIGDIRRTPY